MNPELMRNIWVELTPRRMTMMAVFLALALTASSLTAGGYVTSATASFAEFLYFAIVVLWGTRAAAQSVVGEIRDKTWDLQRLSAIGPWEMVWGKLFGSTLLMWFGGAICLVPLVAFTQKTAGPWAAAIDLGYYVSVGIMAHAGAMLASLIAINRRGTHSRFDVFLYQLAGLLTAGAVYWVWHTASPGGAYTGFFAYVRVDTVSWWGAEFDARSFYLWSLAAFSAWIIAGNYRLMRLELQMTNGPFVWLGFLAFMGIYVAGLDNLIIGGDAGAVANARIALAALIYAEITYAMVLFEPKDRVLYRWLGGALRSGKFGGFFLRLQGWMYSYLLCIVLSLILLARLDDSSFAGLVDLDASRSFIAAALGFLTRDCGIFLLMNTYQTQKRGDFGAILTLIALYWIGPWLAAGMGLESFLYLFGPIPSDPAIAGPIAAWLEAFVVWVLAFGRMELKKTQPERK